MSNALRCYKISKGFNQPFLTALDGQMVEVKLTSVLERPALFIVEVADSNAHVFIKKYAHKSEAVRLFHDLLGHTQITPGFCKMIGMRPFDFALDVS